MYGGVNAIAELYKVEVLRLLGNQAIEKYAHNER
jgi:hypothetical protein